MSDKIAHPAKTVAHRRVLDEIGCGNYSPTAKQSTFDKMVEIGLLVPCGEKVICRDRFGIVTATEYQMPIPVHYKWCSYWAEKYDEEASAPTGDKP